MLASEKEGEVEMPFSTHPPRFTQLVEFLAPLSAVLYLFISSRTTYLLHSLLSFPPNSKPFIQLCRQRIKATEPLLVFFPFVTLLCYGTLANSAHRLSKPVNVCAKPVHFTDPGGGCHDHFHPETTHFNQQWKLYAIALFLVLLIFASNLIVLRHVTFAICVRAAALSEGGERVAEESIEQRERDTGFGVGKEGRRNWGMGWEDGMSDQELVRRWIWTNYGTGALMFAASVVGAAGWWALPAGKRELKWWVD